MIRPTIPCTIASNAGFDKFGKPALSAPKNAKCSVVKLSQSSKKTSVRTDRSASQGNAEEYMADARLLFLPTTHIKVGDIVTIRGIRLVVDVVDYRFTAITEKLDHLMVDLSIWQ